MVGVEVSSRRTKRIIPMTNQLALQPQRSGAGQVIGPVDGWRFHNGPTTITQYTNAQLDDYQGRSRRYFPWRPPVTLTLQARFSHPTAQLYGTAGFGFGMTPFDGRSSAGRPCRAPSGSFLVHLLRIWPWR